MINLIWCWLVGHDLDFEKPSIRTRVEGDFGEYWDERERFCKRCKKYRIIKK